MVVITKKLQPDEHALHAIKGGRFYYPDVKLLIVDLFCGAGGTTLGYEKAFSRAKKLAKVIACVNHDFEAIESHKANHTRVKHFNEDIRTLDLTELIEVVREWRKRCPNAKLVLWASLECTNHSKAKGGLPKDADSRTLAWELYRYIEALDPEYIKIENVVEFGEWGPIDEEGRVIKESKGIFFEGWRHHIRQYGYNDSWTELNAADYGAYQSRNRLFGCFAKYGLPIVWPEPTHARASKIKRLNLRLKQWKPVKEVLDLNDTGDSIFALRWIKKTKKWKPRITSEDTFERIYAGLVKFVAKGDTSYLVHYHGVSKKEDNHHKIMSVDNPARVITASGGEQSLVQPMFLTTYYNGSLGLVPLNSPAHTVTVKDRMSLVSVKWLMNYYNVGHGDVSSVLMPCGTLMTNPKQRLMSCLPFLFYSQYSPESSLYSIEQPGPTLIASMEKTELKMVQVINGKPYIKIDEWDTPIRIKIKKFMAAYGIADILMRGLRIPELKQIQGFPVDYVLKGSQANQKKFIGNAVHKDVVIAWVKALVRSL